MRLLVKLEKIAMQQNSENSGFRLTINFDGAKEPEVNYFPSINGAIIELAGYFEDFGTDTLPAKCEVNQGGQVVKMTFNFCGGFLDEVFPQILSENRVTGAEIVLVNPKKNLESYPIPELLERRNRKHVFAAISGGNVVDLIYVSPRIGRDEWNQVKNECYQLLSNKGKFEHGEVKANRFFVIENFNPPKEKSKALKMAENISAKF